MLLHGSTLQKILFGLLTLILFATGWWLSQTGFSQIKLLRQIERLPVSQITTALEGDIKLKVLVDSAQDTVNSEYFNQPSVYYRYRYEEEETDSDGDTYWDTKFINTGGVDFYASDASGTVLLRSQSRSNSELEFSLPVSRQVTIGATRHTEWRIEPGDALFVMGQYILGDPTASVEFNAESQLMPLISKYTESEEKSGLGTSVILKVCGGVSLFALGALSLVITLGIHRILVFLIVLTLSVIVPLVEHGLSMLNDDIVETERLIEQRNHQLKQKLDLFYGVESSGESDTEYWQKILQKLNSVNLIDSSLEQTLVDTVFLQQQFNRQLKPFPNNLIAWWHKVDEQVLYSMLTPQLQTKVDAKLSQFRRASTSGFWSYLVVAVGILICIVLTWLGFRLIRLKRHIENLPTSKTSGLMYGLSEIKGRVNFSDDWPAMEAPLTYTSCAWFRYIIEERQGSGKDRKWVTIRDTTERVPFLCQDPFGAVIVNPEHAEVLSKRKKVERRGDWRYTEYQLQQNDKLYLLGTAQIDNDSGDRLAIKHDPHNPFLITNYSESAIMYRKAYGGMLSLTLAFAALMFGALFLLGTRGSFAPADYLTAALIAPVYMLLVILIFHYNDLVFLRQRATRNYANIEVSMQKRFDLIPSLEKVVKQYMAHEKNLFKAIVKLRHALDSDELTTDNLEKIIEYEQKIVSSVIARVEQHPDLKANELVTNLMNKLVDLENEIALMREGFNDSVEYYNSRIASLPDVIFARLFGFKSLNLLQFEARRFERIKL